MLHWLRRLTRRQPKLETAPQHTHPTRNCGRSSRRGTTRTPLGMVRLTNRASNRRARAARRVNR